MKHLIRAIGVATLVLAAHDASAQQTVNYGVQPATMPIYIARELGLLDPIEKKHNIKVVFRNFAYGAPENQAMAAGELQMASAGMGPAIIAASRLPSTLVAISILEQTAILVPNDSSLTSVKEPRQEGRVSGPGSQQYRHLLKALADMTSRNDICSSRPTARRSRPCCRDKSVDAGIVGSTRLRCARRQPLKVLVKERRSYRSCRALHRKRRVRAR
jgi:sulfonate transport system substrate-binding protein